MPSPMLESDQDQLFTIRRNRTNLLAALAIIGREGWDGPVATALLTFIRDDLVRPLVLDTGFRGAAAYQAEATGWATAWEVLTDPRLRQAQSPWGVVWKAVGRAIRSEQVAARYGVTARKAWRLAGGDDRGDPTAVPVSFTALTGLGWEPPADRQTRIGDGLGPILSRVVDALQEAGWDPAEAALVVVTIADTITRSGVLSSQLTGWRRVQEQVNLPAWRVRRVTVLLIGVTGWPGLVARLATDGPDVLATDEVQAALRSTVHVSHRSPVLAARRCAAG